MLLACSPPFFAPSYTVSHISRRPLAAPPRIGKKRRSSGYCHSTLRRTSSSDHSSQQQQRPRKNATFGTDRDEDTATNTDDYPLATTEAFQEYDCLDGPDDFAGYQPEAAANSAPMQSHASTASLFARNKRVRSNTAPRYHQQQQHLSWHYHFARMSTSHRRAQDAHRVFSEGSVTHEEQLQRKRDRRRFERHARRPSLADDSQTTKAPAAWRPVHSPSQLPTSQNNTYGAPFGKVFGQADGGQGNLFSPAALEAHSARTMRGTPDMNVYLDRTYGLPGKTPTREAIELHNALYKHIAREGAQDGSAGGADAEHDRIKQWEVRTRRHTVDNMRAVEYAGVPLQRTPRRRHFSPHAMDSFLQLCTPTVEGRLYATTPMPPVATPGVFRAQTPQVECAIPARVRTRQPSTTSSPATCQDEEVGDLLAHARARAQHTSLRLSSSHGVYTHHPNVDISRREGDVLDVLAGYATSDLSGVVEYCDDTPQRVLTDTFDYPDDYVPPTPGRLPDGGDDAAPSDVTKVIVQAEKHASDGISPGPTAMGHSDDDKDDNDAQLAAPPSRYTFHDDDEEEARLLLLSPPRQVLDESIARCQDWMARSPPGAEQILPLFQPGWVTAEPLTDVIDGQDEDGREARREALRVSVLLSPCLRKSAVADSGNEEVDDAETDARLPRLSSPRRVPGEAIARLRNCMARSPSTVHSPPTACSMHSALVQFELDMPSPLREVTGVKKDNGIPREALCALGMPSPGPAFNSKDDDVSCALESASTAATPSQSPDARGNELDATEWMEVWRAVRRMIGSETECQQPRHGGERTRDQHIPTASRPQEARRKTPRVDLGLPERSCPPLQAVRVIPGNHRSDRSERGVLSPLRIKSPAAAQPQLTTMSTFPTMGTFGSLDTVVAAGGEDDENVPLRSVHVEAVAAKAESLADVSMDVASHTPPDSSSSSSSASSGMSSLVRQSGRMALRPMRSDVTMRSVARSAVGGGEAEDIEMRSVHSRGAGASGRSRSRKMSRPTRTAL